MIQLAYGYHIIMIQSRIKETKQIYLQINKRILKQGLFKILNYSTVFELISNLLLRPSNINKKKKKTNRKHLRTNENSEAIDQYSAGEKLEVQQDVKRQLDENDKTIGRIRNNNANEKLDSETAIVTKEKKRKNNKKKKLNKRNHTAQDKLKAANAVSSSLNSTNAHQTTTQATLYGLASLKRTGDVKVTQMIDYTTVKSNFILGPLTLKVEKIFGRGELRQATAKTQEMIGRINLRIVNGVATLHSVKVQQPKQVSI